MSSPEVFQKILDAYYEAEFAEPSEQAAKTTTLEALLDQAIAGTPYSRQWLVEAMRDRYKEYSRKRRKREGIPGNILEGKPPEISP